MSWSLNVVGTRDNIRAALKAESSRLTGQSKEEFDDALPHLDALLELNINTANLQQLYELEASGHASFTDGRLTYRSVNVSKLGSFGKRLV